METIGEANIKKAVPDAVSIFILPPSLEILKDRLVKRGTETPELVEIRFSQACEEIKCAFDYDYIVVNDDREKCLKSVAAIIEAERKKGFRNTDLAKQVLDNKTVSD